MLVTKKNILIALMLLLVLACNENNGRSRTGEGLFGGALGGALIGGLAGGGKGAGIGAGVGAAVGLMAGSAADRRAEERYYSDDYDYGQPQSFYYGTVNGREIYYSYDPTSGQPYYFDRWGNEFYF